MPPPGDVILPPFRVQAPVRLTVPVDPEFWDGIKVPPEMVIFTAFMVHDPVPEVPLKIPPETLTFPSTVVVFTAVPVSLNSKPPVACIFKLP